MEEAERQCPRAGPPYGGVGVGAADFGGIECLLRRALLHLEE